MGKGKLIVFEGIDGAGKATQVKLLVKKLRAEGKQVTVFTSPRYDLPTGRLVKDALQGKFGNFVGLSPYLSGTPYLLDFAAWRDEVKAALKKGVVVCDRYVPSTVAYHSAKLSGSSAGAFIRWAENIAYKQLRLPEPSTVIYLDVAVTTAQHLMRKKKKDQHERAVGYQKRVAAAYRALGKRKNWAVITCTKGGVMLSEDKIHGQIWKALQ